MPEEKAKSDVEALREMLRRIQEKPAAAPKRPPAVVLEQVVAGRVVETPKGPCYVVEQGADEFLAGDDDFAATTELFFARGQTNREHLERLDSALSKAAEIEPERILFLDIETAGFHGTALFLVGLLLCSRGRFHIKQLFARNYAEEAAVLNLLRDFYNAADVVITFNGRAFDLPFISDRCLVHKVKAARPAMDIDLLHIARRIWRGVLPDCRLATLEHIVCGRTRTGDLPSHLIPQAYHDFVETGDARLMVDVIRHNAYDLVTMAHLLARIANG